MAEFLGRVLERRCIEFEEMEAEHEVLLQQMETLARRELSGAAKADLSRLLGELDKHIVQHFANEEACMAANDYPRLKAHRAIHEDLLATLRERVGEFEAGDGKLGNRMLSFLRFTLSAHIRGFDKPYTPRGRPRAR